MAPSTGCTSLMILFFQGIFSLTSSEKQCLVQAVYEIYDKTLTTEWGDKDRVNRIIVIGKLCSDFFVYVKLSS